MPPANPYYQGPVSDHFDGTRFFHPDAAAAAPADRGLAALLRWRLSGRRARWPRSYPSPFVDVPPVRVGGLRVGFVGHASFLVQVAGINLLIDPVWSDRASPFAAFGPRRVNPPGIGLGSLPPIDAVLLTHNHYDHLDLATLARLWARGRPRLIVPLGNDAIIRAALPEARVEALDWGGYAALSPAVVAHLRPALHWSARGFKDRRMALWGAWLLATPAGAVYAVGDTGFGDGAQFAAVRTEFGPPRLALLPIGAYAPRWFMQAQHMNPDEAVRAFLALGTQQALGHHWGTFRLTDEPIEEPPAALATALAAHNVAPHRFRALRPGEVWTA